MISDAVREELKDALRAKDQLRVDTLRSVLAAFTSELVAKGRKPTDSLSDEEQTTVVKRLVKQRKDAIEQFEKGGRPELAKKEADERVILERYLPQMASEEEIERVARAKASQAGASDPAALGKLTGAVMKEFGGNADGGLVRSTLERVLKEGA